MIVPDANLLLYAVDEESVFHDRARSWWEECLSSPEPVGLTFPVLFAFVRVGTSSRVFNNPLSLEEACDHIQRWLERRVVQILRPTQNHLNEVIDLLSQAKMSGGNMVTDAQIAALAIAHRAVVNTADRDFARFQNLRCRYPLDE